VKKRDKQHLREGVMLAGRFCVIATLFALSWTLECVRPTVMAMPWQTQAQIASAMAAAAPHPQPTNPHHYGISPYGRLHHPQHEYEFETEDEKRGGPVGQGESAWSPEPAQFCTGRYGTGRQRACTM